MAVDAKRYFRGLRSYLNTNHYENTKRDNGRLVLEEKVFLSGGKEKKYKVRLGFKGEIVVIHLDKPNSKGNTDPLFHFLDDNAKPWSKRCDFVIFQFHNRKINIYAIEFKSSHLPNTLSDQLKATENWCRSVHSIINLYTGEKKRMNLRKFVFSCMDDPSRFIDDDGYYNHDHTIKHFHYDELAGKELEELDNDCPILIG